MARYRTSLGHVHLKVRDLARSVAFYQTILGLEVTERASGGFVFLSGSGAHHDLALQELGVPAISPPANAVGLYHTAWEVPDQHSLSIAYNTLVAAGLRVEAVDQGISWALYCRDPDGNGVEIYLDRRVESGRDVWQGHARTLRASEIVPALTRRDAGG